MYSLKNHGESGAGVQTTTGNVEVQLTDRDTHATETKVTETKDTGAVSDDDDLGLGFEGGGVLGQNLAELGLR